MIVIESKETVIRRGQYIVSVNGFKDRLKFINYIKNKYKLNLRKDVKSMASSKFPFVVDFGRKEFWVCESITCLAMAQQSGLIISEEQFRNRVL